MSKVITVRHTAPVLYVPRRSRKERRVDVTLSTPVSLREVSPAEIGPPVACLTKDLGGLGDRLHYHAFEGRYWHDLRGWAMDAPLARSDFEDFLAGETVVPDTRLHQLERVFLLTPVWQRGLGTLPGVDPDPATVGRMLDDCRDEWRDHLRRFLHDNVVVAGETVYVRSSGPQASVQAVIPRTTFFYDKFPRLSQTNRFMQSCRPDRIDDFARLKNGGEPYNVGLDLSGFDPALFGDDDILLFAQMAPKKVHDGIFSRWRVIRDEAFDAFAAVEFDRLRRWDRRGSIGALGMGEAEALLSELQGIMRRMQELDPYGWPATGLRPLEAYIQGFALPRLAGQALAAEDEQAFEGLAGPM